MAFFFYFLGVSDLKLVIVTVCSWRRWGGQWIGWLKMGLSEVWGDGRGRGWGGVGAVLVGVCHVSRPANFFD